MNNDILPQVFGELISLLEKLSQLDSLRLDKRVKALESFAGRENLTAAKKLAENNAALLHQFVTIREEVEEMKKRVSGCAKIGQLDRLEKRLDDEFGADRRELLEVKQQLRRVELERMGLVQSSAEAGEEG